MHFFTSLQCLLHGTVFLLEYVCPSLVPETKDYCSLETFAASCATNEVVNMRSATYGLMRIGRCMESDFGHLGCHSDQLAYLDQLCSGRQECQLSVTNSKEMQENTPCPSGLSPYLEASYTCQNVLEMHQGTCHTPLKLKSGSTTISSITSEKSHCGTTDSPLIMETSPGQKINISLIDFSWGDSGYDLEKGQCQRLYGHIVSYDNSDILEICGGSSRLKHIHTAASHVIQIAFDEAALQHHIFLLDVEVFGCPDIVPPLNSWVRKTGEKIVIGCHSGPETWEMKCIGNHWIGVTGNCTKAQSQSSTQIMEIKEEFNESHVLAIGIGCLAFVACCITVTIGVFFIKRYKTKLSLESNYGKLNKMNQIQQQATINPHQGASQFTTLVARGTMPTGNREQTMRSNVIQEYLVPTNGGETLLSQPGARGHQRTVSQGGTEPQYENTQYRGNDRESVLYYVLENPPGYNDTQTGRN